MRILQLVHQYLPEYVGGTEFYTQWLSHELSQRNHDISIFYRHDGELNGKKNRFDDAVFVWESWHGTLTPTRRFLATFSDRPITNAFAEVLQEIKPDLVHVHHAMGMPVSIFDEIKQFKTPYVITIHDYWWVCSNAQLLTNYSQEICDGPKAFLNCARCALARSDLPNIIPALPLLALPLAWRNYLLRQVLNGASKIIVSTNFVHDWYVSHGVSNDKLIVKPLGLDYPEMFSKRPWDGKRPLRVGYIGGLTWQKGVHVLVEAFSTFEGPGELWIAGDKTFDPLYVGRLEKLANSYTKFLGKLDRDGIWNMLSQIDIIVVTSLWYETFCFVISEAFATGVPVIASNLGVMAERVKDGVNGFLVPPGNVTALRDTLRKISQDPNLLFQLQSNINHVPTIQEHVADIEAIYRQVLLEKNGR